jgi:hypothetical protein
VTDDGRVVPHDEAKAFDVVILAVGFGDRGAAAPSTWDLQVDGKRDGLSDARRCA